MKAFHLLLPLLIFCSVPAIAGDFAGNQPGFSLSVGNNASWLDLDASAQDLLLGDGNRLEESGRGGSLDIGYTFDHNFRLNLRFAGSEHQSTDGEYMADYVIFLIEGAVPLSSGRVQPYLLAGVGAAGVAVNRNGLDRLLLGSAADFGGGVEAWLGRRWSLAMDYRMLFANYEDFDGGLIQGPVEESGQSQHLSARVSFSF